MLRIGEYMVQSINFSLPQRILLTLSKQPAVSIASLARELNALRPSVSRAVSSLLEKNLVVKQGRALHLTNLGQEEVETIKSTLPDKAKKSTESVKRMIEQASESWELVEHLMDMNEIKAVSKELQPLQNIAALVSPLSIGAPSIKASDDYARLYKSIDQSTFRLAQEAVESMQMLQEAASNIPMIQAAVNTDMYDQMQELVNTTAYVQTMNLDFVQVASYSWKPILIDANECISNIISSIEAVSQINFLGTPSLEGLVYQTNDLVKAYDTYYKDIVDQFNVASDLVGYNEISILAPSIATSSVVGSVRTIIESRTTRQNNSASVDEVKGRINKEKYVATISFLDEYIAPLGERFIRKWHGAWQTLSSDSEDRAAQALHSGRELVMQLLAELAPDAVFTKEDLAKHKVDKVSRRMRVKYILDNSKKPIEWTENLAATIDSTYDFLAAGSHKRDGIVPSDESVAGLLLGLGSLLMFLLQNRDSSSLDL